MNAAYPDPQRLYYVYTLAIGIQSGSVSGSAIPPAYNNPLAIGFRFQVLRTPNRVGNPIELVAGTCIDMEYCGMGAQGGELRRCRSDHSSSCSRPAARSMA